jgi:TonB-linked SusC/RagA family outer membrane protein
MKLLETGRFLTCLLLLLSFSFGMNAQTTQKGLSINVKDGTILDCLRAIEKQTDYVFIFNDTIGADRKETFECKNSTLSDVLDKVLKPNEIDWEIVGRQIILRKAAPKEKSRTITGHVCDQGNNPIPGAAVVDKGTGTGTVTDINGRFSIDAPFGDRSFEISSLGYSSREIKVPAGKNSVDVFLSDEAMSLDALVVVGYGTQKKVNLTGAISTVSADNIADRTAPTLTHMLQGSVPGLNVTTSSGRPGNTASINIRGINSINGGSPLVLVDGVQGDLSQINPNDVDNISIIKDASSAAIYGARASFGVILVTTKSGSASDGKATVRYSGRYGWTAPTTSTDYESRGYWSVYLNDLFFKANAGVNYTRYTDEDMDQLWARRNDKVENPDRPWTVIDRRNGQDIYLYYANTDWYHYFFKDISPTMTHNISLSGGAKGIKYYVSGNYDRSEGIYRMNTDIDNKYNFRSHISFDVNSWINFSTNTSFYSEDYTYPGTSGVDTAFSQTAQHALASFPTHNPDGSNVIYTALTSYNIANGYGAVLSDGKASNKDIDERFTETAELTLTPIKGLEIKGNFTYAMNSETNYNRFANTSYSQYPGTYQTISTGSLFEDHLQEVRNQDRYYQANFYATYTKTFAQKHNVKLTAGYNYETKRYKNVKAVGYYQMTEDLNDLNLTGTGADGNKRTDVSGGQSEYALEGVFGRANYDYDGKYLFEASGRYDGSSRFGSGHQWGFFPSASVGWRISEEPFFKGLKPTFSNLKLRYSFGQLGNQQVGYYDYIRKISISSQTYLLGGTTKPTIASIGAPVASDLSWEVAQHQNLGIDMSFLNGKLAFTGEAYIRDTKDMLTDGIALPATYGASSPEMNSANMRTRGYELTLAWKDVFTLAGKPFSYGATAVYSDYTSFITKFDNPDKIFAKTFWKGYKWGDIWGYTVDGYFASDEEAANYKVDQTLVNQVLNAAAGSEKGLHAGDLKYVDLDGDGVIKEGTGVNNPGDRRVIGNSLPRYNYGLTLDAQWEGFDFSIFFQGIGHMDWYPPASAIIFWGPYVRPYASYIPKDFYSEIWTKENPNAYFPRPRGYVAMNSANSELGHINTKYLQNIGYLRLKNLTLGYTIPSKISKMVGISKARAYFSGENLMTWCGIHSDYIDPEMAMTGGQMRIYPWRKTYMFGLDITF